MSYRRMVSVRMHHIILLINLLFCDKEVLGSNYSDVNEYILHSQLGLRIIRAFRWFSDYLKFPPLQCKDGYWQPEDCNVELKLSMQIEKFHGYYKHGNFLMFKTILAMEWTQDAWFWPHLTLDYPMDISTHDNLIWTPKVIPGVIFYRFNARMYETAAALRLSPGNKVHHKALKLEVPQYVLMNCDDISYVAFPWYTTTCRVTFHRNILDRSVSLNCEAPANREYIHSSVCTRMMRTAFDKYIKKYRHGATMRGWQIMDVKASHNFEGTGINLQIFVRSLQISHYTFYLGKTISSHINKDQIFEVIF